jgi:hypothetical protein
MKHPFCVLLVMAALQTAGAQTPTGDTILKNIVPVGGRLYRDA